MMVEAILYLPLVIATVVFLIYIGLFKFQEAAFLYAVERVAQYGANEAAYPGYSVFADTISSGINFGWSGTSALSEDMIKGYYEASHKDFPTLYREIFGPVWVDEGKISSQYEDVVTKANILAIARGADYSVEMKRGIFGTQVVVGVSYSIKTPGIMRYLGLKPSYSYKRASFGKAINPADFTRTVDLTVDVAYIIADKLGVDLDGAFQKVSEFLDKYW